MYLLSSALKLGRKLRATYIEEISMIDDTMVLLEYGTPEHTAWLKDNSCNGTFVQHFGTKWVGALRSG